MLSFDARGKRQPWIIVNELVKNGGGVALSDRVGWNHFYFFSFFMGNIFKDKIEKSSETWQCNTKAIKESPRIIT